MSLWWVVVINWVLLGITSSHVFVLYCYRQALTTAIWGVLKAKSSYLQVRYWFQHFFSYLFIWLLIFIYRDKLCQQQWHSMSNFHHEVQICIHTVIIEALCYAAIITPDIWISLQHCSFKQGCVELCLWIPRNIKEGAQHTNKNYLQKQ